MKSQKGFTLIELLLVLAIIGIISAIAIPALLGQREKAKVKAVQSMVANVAGECARVNDDLRQAAGGTVTSAAVVITSAHSRHGLARGVLEQPICSRCRPDYSADRGRPIGACGNRSFARDRVRAALRADAACARRHG